MRDVKFLSFESAIRGGNSPLGILDLMAYVEPSDGTRLNICTLVFKKTCISDVPPFRSCPSFEEVLHDQSALHRKGRTTPSLTPQVLHFIRECVPKSEQILEFAQ